jgi:predicted nucleotidyltransferase
MDQHHTNLPPNYQVLLARLKEICQADDHIVAVFLGGSYAAGTADSHSDLDLGLITTDDGHEPFLADLNSFVRRLGDPLFLETFDLANIIFFVFADGTEGEIAVGSISSFNHIHIGPYVVILDKIGILADATFPGENPTHDSQIETARRHIYWFWHDLSHFITAMSRNQLWWAHGQLEILRSICVNLALLHENITAEARGYEKLDRSLRTDLLSPLQTTFCPLDYKPMIQAMQVIIRYYRQIAPQLAQKCGIAYPDQLAEILLGQFNELVRE